MRRSSPGTRSPARRSAATRISPISRPTRSCSRCRRPSTACSSRSSTADGAVVTSGQVLALLEPGGGGVAGRRGRKPSAAKPRAVRRAGRTSRSGSGRRGREACPSVAAAPPDTARRRPRGGRRTAWARGPQARRGTRSRPGFDRGLGARRPHHEGRRARLHRRPQATTVGLDQADARRRPTSARAARRAGSRAPSSACR